MFTLSFLISFLVAVLVILVVLWVTNLVLGMMTLPPNAKTIILAIIGLVCLLVLLRQLGIWV